MRQITTREKVFLSIAVLAAVAVFVYLILLPMLGGAQAAGTLSTAEIRQRLEATKKIQSLADPLTALKERMKKQSGYGDMSFKRGIADSMIMNYLANAASRAEIGNLEQLDAKPYKGKTRTTGMSNRNVLVSTVDQLYLVQVTSEGQDTESAGEKESGKKATDAADSGNAKKQENMKFLFPPIPKNIPAKVRQSLIDVIKKAEGRTPSAADTKAILDTVGIDDEKERKHIAQAVKIYADRVREEKSNILQALNSLGILGKVHTKQKTDLFSVKVVFKSQIDQLVKFLYDLQTNAKWLKMENARISISDRKQNVLGVELSMIATVIYE